MHSLRQATITRAKKSFKECVIPTLIDASIRRMDKNHLRLQNLTDLNIRVSCFVTYFRESSINAAAQKAPASFAKKTAAAAVNHEILISKKTAFSAARMHLMII